MDYYPGSGNFKCTGKWCKKTYRLEEIWEKTGTDINGEVFEFKCQCKKKLRGKLNLNLMINMDKYVKNIKKTWSNFDTNEGWCTRENNHFFGSVDICRNERNKLSIYFHELVFKKPLIITDKEEDECPICYEPCQTTTDCGHGICIKCYNKIELCPMCRANYQKFSIYHDLYHTV